MGAMGQGGLANASERVSALLFHRQAWHKSESLAGQVVVKSQAEENGKRRPTLSFTSPLSTGMVPVYFPPRRSKYARLYFLYTDNNVVADNIDRSQVSLKYGRTEGSPRAP